MNVRDIMTRDPVCCGPRTPLPQVARLMVDCNCGEIPVVDDNGLLIGVITDRDITCRAVAKDRNPLELMARDCMSFPVVTVTPDTSLEECCDTMEINQVRRLPVIDGRGSCCGIVAQAEIARRATEDLTAHVVRDVSQPTDAPSAVRMP
jgi:CBS domain-containing protein